MRLILNFELQLELYFCFVYIFFNTWRWRILGLVETAATVTKAHNADLEVMTKAVIDDDDDAVTIVYMRSHSDVKDLRI